MGQGKAGVWPRSTGRSAALLAAIFGGWLADLWMGTPTRKNLRERDRHGAVYSRALQCGQCGDVAPFRFGIGLTLFGLGWGFFDCNNMPILCQWPGPNASHRLRHHEPRQYQFRRIRRLGLWDIADRTFPSISFSEPLPAWPSSPFCSF